MHLDYTVLNSSAIWNKRLTNMTNLDRYTCQMCSFTRACRKRVRHYLRALSRDRPDRSKKLRYSDATSWLKSLLKGERERGRGGEREREQGREGEFHIDVYQVIQTWGLGEGIINM